MPLTTPEGRLNEHPRYAAAGCNTMAAATAVTGVFIPLSHPEIGTQNVIALIVVAVARHLVGHYLLFATIYEDRHGPQLAPSRGATRRPGHGDRRRGLPDASIERVDARS